MPPLSIAWTRSWAPAGSADLFDQATLVSSGGRVRLELDLVHEAAHEQQPQAALPRMLDVFLGVRQHHLIAGKAPARMPDVDLQRLLGEAQLQFHAVLALAAVGMEDRSEEHTSE